MTDAELVCLAVAQVLLRYDGEHWLRAARLPAYDGDRNDPGAYRRLCVHGMARPGLVGAHGVW